MMFQIAKMAGAFSNFGQIKRIAHGSFSYYTQSTKSNWLDLKEKQSDTRINCYLPTTVN